MRKFSSPIIKFAIFVVVVAKNTANWEGFVMGLPAQRKKKKSSPVSPAVVFHFISFSALSPPYTANGG